MGCVEYAAVLLMSFSHMKDIKETKKKTKIKDRIEE